MRRRLEAFVNHPATDLTVVVLILTSIGLLVVEATLPERSPLFEAAEWAGHVLTGLFIVELLLRLVAMPSRQRFLRVYWLDVLAVVPVVRGLRILRVLRLLRLFRVGVLLNRRLTGLTDALRQGKAELLTVGVVVLIVVLAGAIGMNLAERGQDPIFDTMEGATWWSLYSLVAAEPVLGSPHTFLGKGLALLVMLGGMGFFAMFTGIVSAAMVNRLSRRMEAREMALEDVRNHIVLCGWNRAAVRVLRELQSDPELRGKPLVLVAERPEPPELGVAIPPERFFFLSADFTRMEVLHQAGIERADIAILLADRSLERSDQDRDARTVLAALTIEKLNADIFTCVELLNRDNRQHLSIAGVEEVVVPDEYAGSLIAASSRNRGLIAVMDELLTSAYGNQFYKAPLPAAWVGRSVGWAHGELKQHHAAVLVSLERQADGQTQTWVNPPAEEALQAGDALVFIAERFPAGLGQAKGQG